MTYFEELQALKESLVAELSNRGIPKHYLAFGGHGEKPAKKPTIPTDARSEFLANRAMGDWAEKILAAAIRQNRPAWQICSYGNAQRIAAGEDGFKEFYLQGMEEVRKYGKRPDLLIFPEKVLPQNNVTDLPFEEIDPHVPQAIGSLEVRSSKFEAHTYINTRKKQKAAGKKVSQDTPSFTIKVEDLKIVYRWIERYRVAQAYTQVFFDSAYVIDFLDIVRVVASGEGFRTTKPQKSQLKWTFMIPITKGEQLGTFLLPPTYETEERVTELGRHDAYVVPKGGQLEVDCSPLDRMFRA